MPKLLPALCSDVPNSTGLPRYLMTVIFPLGRAPSQRFMTAVGCIFLSLTHFDPLVYGRSALYLLEHRFYYTEQVSSMHGLRVGVGGFA